MNIIKERDARNKNRIMKKKQYDGMMTLSTQESGWYPLLSEGMVTYGDGSPWFYIMRGALARFYDSLSEDYEGSINIGHTDMASFPERIVGKWTKRNLRLEEEEDGRYTLYTDLPVKDDHPLVEALRKADFDVGLSVEMTTSQNYELTNDREINPFGVPIVEDLFIWDYAIVGDAGDVNSMGIHLKGGSELQMNELAKLLSKEGGENIAEITKLMDQALSDAETEEETSEEAEEETAEEESTEEEATEEEGEEAASEDEEESSEDEAEEETVADETTFMAVMSQLADELKALREENADLKAQLAARNTAEAEFVKKFKKLSVSLSATPKAKPAAEHKVYTDGIGE